MKAFFVTLNGLYRHIDSGIVITLYFINILAVEILLFFIQTEKIH